MPSFLNTPESLLPRSDSKNPSTTCKGITSNGRPCRRSLASSPGNSPGRFSQGRGVVAIAPNVGEHHENAAAYFCWQHKDQAANLIVEQGNSQVLELKERNSIDTLVDRLGVLEVEDRSTRKTGRRGKAAANTIRRDTLPGPWQGVSSPLMLVPETFTGPSNTPLTTTSLPHASQPIKTQRRRGDIHFSFFCCMDQPVLEDLPAPRPRPSPVPEMTTNVPTLSGRPALSVQSHAQSSSVPTLSQTSRFSSYIPTSLPATTASVLMAELAKPLTPSDHEPGYIYIFWLTPATIPQTAANAASSLLAPPRRSDRAAYKRRASDVLRDFGEIVPENNRDRSDQSRSQRPERRTIMLKIGRASNVHRRMVQWTKQCGHHITLLRYYPNPNYRSPSPSPSPSRSPVISPAASRKSVPQSPSPSSPQKSSLIPRVERLIHLELQDKRVMRSCDGCGKEHREWFEVEASREGVRAVDDCVRRWVGWALQETARQR